MSFKTLDDDCGRDDCNRDERCCIGSLNYFEYFGRDTTGACMADEGRRGGSMINRY